MKKSLILTLFSYLALFSLFTTAAAWADTKSQWWDLAFVMSVIVATSLYEARGRALERELNDNLDEGEDDEEQGAAEDEAQP